MFFGDFHLLKSEQTSRLCLALGITQGVLAALAKRISHCLKLKVVLPPFDQEWFVQSLTHVLVQSGYFLKCVNWYIVT